MIAEQALAIFLVNRFYELANSKKKCAHSVLEKLELFEGPTMHREHRGGIYGWLSLDDEIIASSIDWVLKYDILPARIILGYARIYAKALARDPNQYIEVSSEQVEKIVG